MALIKCPDCGTEVSDRAKACPKCGFPIDEYIAELATEKAEKERQESIQKIKESEEYLALQKETSFKIGGHTITYTGDHARNLMIHALFDSGYRKSLDLIKDRLVPENAQEFDTSMVYARDANTKHNYIYGFILNSIREVIMPIATKYAVGYSIYVEDVEDEVAESFILNNIEATGFWSDIYEPAYNIIRQTFNDLETCVMNIISAKHDLDSTDGDFITSVRANSISELIHASINQEIINWISRGVHKSVKGYKTRYNKFVEEYYATEYEGLVKFYDVVFSELHSLVIEICGQLMGAMIENYTLINPELEFYFPRMTVDDNLIGIEKKSEQYDALAKSLLTVSVCYSSTYLSAFANISNSESDIKELYRLAEFFDISEHVKNGLSDDNIRIQVLQDADKVDTIFHTSGSRITNKQEAFIEQCMFRYKNYEKTCSVLQVKLSPATSEDIKKLEHKLISADGYTFPNKDEKKNYLSEKKKYAEVFNKVLATKPEDALTENVSLLKSYIELGEPQNEHLKEVFSKNIELATKRIEKAAKHPEAYIVKEFLQKFNRVALYSIIRENTPEWKSRQEYFSLIDGLEEDDSAVYYQDKEKTVVFTVYGFYIFKDKKLQDIVYLQEIKDIQIVGNDKEVIVGSEHTSLHMFGFAGYKACEVCYDLFHDYSKKARAELETRSLYTNKENIGGTTDTIKSEIPPERQKLEQEKLKTYSEGYSSLIDSSPDGELIAKIKKAFEETQVKYFYTYPSDDFLKQALVIEDKLEENEYPIVIHYNKNYFCLTNKGLKFGTAANLQGISYSIFQSIFLDPLRKQINFGYKKASDDIYEYYNYIPYSWFYNEEEDYRYIPLFAETIVNIFNLKYNDGTDKLLRKQHSAYVDEVLSSSDSYTEKYRRIKEDTRQFGLIDEAGNLISFTFENQFIFDYKYTVMPILAVLKIYSIYGTNIKDYKANSLDEINSIIADITSIYLSHDILVNKDNETILNPYYRFDSAKENTYHESVKKIWEHLFDEKKRLQSIDDLKGVFKGLFKGGKKNVNTIQNKQNTPSMNNTRSQVTNQPVLTPQNEIVFCSSCGKQIPRTANFCGFCGAKNNQ